MNRKFMFMKAVSAAAFYAQQSNGRLWQVSKDNFFAYDFQFVSCLFSGPFDYAFVWLFKRRFYSLDLHCLVGMWTGYNVQITKSKF